MYRTDEIPEGSYELKLVHPAFETKTTTATIVEGKWAVESASLTPIVFGPGEAPFDLTVQVRGAISNWGISEVPVRVQRFKNATDATPTHDLLLRADKNGIARYYGAPTGYYRLEINETGQENSYTGWESYSTEGTIQDKTLVDQAHMIGVYLKPIPQTLTFDVSGYDFIKERHEQPLSDIFVECTGRSPTTFGTELLPPQVDVTDENGRVSFRGLPGIEYFVEFKRLGYSQESRTVFPDKKGLIPSDPEAVKLGTHLHGIAFELNDHNYLDNGTVRVQQPLTLEGIPGTNTDQVIRNASAWEEIDLNGDGFPDNQRRTQNMLVGSYQVANRGSGWFNLTAPVAVGGPEVSHSFQFLAVGKTDVVSVPESLGWNQTVIHPYSLEIQKTTVTGRVVAADQCVPRGSLPAYHPLPGVSLTFKEKEGLDVLPVGEKEITVETDAAGEYTIELYPGIYGLEIEGEPADHMAVNIQRRNLIDPTGFLGTGQVPWPVVKLWPSDPGFQKFWGVNGIPINGIGQNDLEIRLRKEVYCVETPISVDCDVLERRVVYDVGTSRSSVADSDLISETIAILASDNGDVYRGKVFLDSNSQARVRWEDVPPGIYSTTFSHPRYSFDSNVHLTLRDWPAPGVIPEGGEFDTTTGLENFTFVESIPLETFELPGVTGVLENKENPSVKVQRWNSATEEYSTPRGAVIRFVAFDFADGFFEPRQAVAGTWKAYIWENGFYGAGPGEVISLGGPGANTPETPEGLNAFDIQVSTYLANDPEVEVEGVHFTVWGDASNTVHQTPITLSNQIGNPLVRKAQEDKWVWQNVLPLPIDFSGERPLISYKVLVRKAMAFELTVTNSTTQA
ncbi:MAG: hypothetical protein AAF514_17620, partial [Verrucomicrobiota bacterium]